MPQRAESLFEEIVIENFPILEKDTIIHVQETQRSLFRFVYYPKTYYNDVLKG
jgi:hypothetical protein